MKVKALAPWFGSNRMLAAEAAALLDGCCWVGIPFAGGMCEVAHIKARSIAVNDLHRHVMNLALCIACPDRKAKLVELMDASAYHPDTLEKAQIHCRCEEDKRPACLLSGGVEWAAAYFLCAWLTRHGQAGTDGEFRAGLAIRWNAAGGDNCKHFRGAVRALDDWQKIMQRCTFTCLDAFDFLAKCKDAEGHGIYCDPPFPGPGDAYKHRFTHECHRRLAEVLGAYQQTRVVCRYYDVAFIRALYPEPRWRWQRLKGRKQTNAEAPEVLIVNGPAY